MFVQGDKQSDPAALEHQQMNSDEVRVNIRRVPMAEMMNVEKTHTHTHMRTGAGSAAGARLWLQWRPAQFGISLSNGRSAEIPTVGTLASDWVLTSWTCETSLKGPACEICWTLVVRIKIASLLLGDFPLHLSRSESVLVKS